MVKKTSSKKTTKRKSSSNSKKTITKKPTTKSATKKKTVEVKSKPKKVINAKLKDYSYLERTPFSHQFEAAQFLLQKKKAILADDMGAGKTFSSILAMNSLQGNKLIVCPASLKLNWKKEIKNVSNEVINIISNKKWIKPTRNSWTIINYDILGNYIEEIKKANFVSVVFDEAHFCKKINHQGKPTSKRAKFSLRIANQMDFVFLLTGTPISNKTKDIFNLLKMVKHPLSKDFKAFAQRYCDPQFNGFGYNYDGSSNQEELNQELQTCMMRRLKKDLLELPDKIRSFIPVDINIKEYTQKVNEYMSKRKELNGRHEHLVYLNAMRHTLAKEKIKHTVKLVEDLLDQDEPVVVFTSYNAVVDEICSHFPQAVTVVGKDSEEERQKSVNDFQSGKSNLIVCNLIAGGTGITLTRAKNEIIQDLDWVPSTSSQAEDRIYRIGQNENVNIHYVYAENTIDEKMALLLEDKLININKIVDDNDEGFLDEVINWLDINENVMV